jgi:hypothetical protein
VEDGVDVAGCEGPVKLRLPPSVTDALTVTEPDPTLVVTFGAPVPEAVPPLVFTDGAPVPVELNVNFAVTLRVVPSTADVLPIVPSFTALPVTVPDPPACDGTASEPVVSSVTVSPFGSVTAEVLPPFELLSSMWPLSAALPDVDGGASWLDVPFTSGIWPPDGAPVPVFGVVFAWAARTWTPALVTGEAGKDGSPVTDGATKRVAPAIASPLRTSVHAADTPRERRRVARMDHLLKLCESPPRLLLRVRLD